MKVLLVTLHAKYVHASLALPYLASFCGALPGISIEAVELTVNELKDQILARLHAKGADLVLFSCYLWNTELILKTASDLKKLAPKTIIVLGGPEVSYGSFDLMEKHPEISCIVRGEGEFTCRELLEAVVEGTPLADVAGLSYREGDDIVANPDREPITQLDLIPSPFALGLVELGKPLVYFESSRGCPFSCAFCMSSLEKGVRSFSSSRIESDLGLLMEKRVATVKFVDRTFNYDHERANAIWRFILARNRGSRFHFEIAADLLSEENLELLAEVPPDTFRFEIGVQSTTEETLAQVGRHSQLAQVFENVRRLKESTAVTVHLDLVAGLPGEDFPGFSRSLQTLLDLEPDHIQIEPLKVMKGTKMRSIARKLGYAYSETAPYKVLTTPWLSFDEIRRIEGISRLLDTIHNSGRFAATLGVLAESAPLSELYAALEGYFEAQAIPPNLSILPLFEALWRFGSTLGVRLDKERLRDALTFDYCLVGYPGGNLPEFFRPEPKEERPVLKELPKARPGERLRYYLRRFERDYRVRPWHEAPAEICFIYRSAPGKGLTVELR